MQGMMIPAEDLVSLMGQGGEGGVETPLVLPSLEMQMWCSLRVAWEPGGCPGRGGSFPALCLPPEGGALPFCLVGLLVSPPPPV